MSTEDQNKVVITLHKGVNKDTFINWMIEQGYELKDSKPGSKRNIDFVMTLEQAEILKKDSRVLDTRFGSKAENNIFPTLAALESNKTYDKTNTVSRDVYNWAHVACTTNSDLFNNNLTNITYQFPYSVDGTGIDIVIQDSGVEPFHPEFYDITGYRQRRKLIDWPSAAGLSGSYTQPTEHNRDVNGHGTHVAGTAAGRLYGWAKNADIYAIKILDDPGQTFGASASFNLIRGWHNLKTNNRPTVVNMSWGYFGTYADIADGSYRGVGWGGNTMDATKGMIQMQSNEGFWTHPIRVASVDADIEDCIDDGIILIGAAGNGGHKIDVPSGADYNNYFNSNSQGNNRYYHRGSSPSSATGVICVGNISYVYDSDGNGPKEPLFNSSEKGPRVDISAPGGMITSIVPKTASLAAGGLPYPVGDINWRHRDFDSDYTINKLSGTSMAAPQVTGIVACALQANPYLDSDQELVKQWLIDNSEKNRLFDPTTGVPSTDYSKFRALQGAPNRYLKTPYTNSIPGNLSGGGFTNFNIKI